MLRDTVLALVAMLLGNVTLDVIDKAQKITTGVLLIIIVYGSYKEWWVTGRQYRRALAERDHAIERLEKKINGLEADNMK